MKLLSKKAILTNLTVICVSFLFCLLLFEIALRLFWTNPANYAAATDESLFWRYDSLLGWSMEPNARGKFIRPEFTTTVATNRLGLRDDDIPFKKAENEFRILLLGDSVVAGFEVEKEETLEAQLERRLNQLKDGRKYQVINAGFRGYGTDQELLFLKNRGLPLKPDVVILAFVPANDPENNVTVHTGGRKYAKPYFVYDAQKRLVLRGVPVPKSPPGEQIYSPVLRNQAPDSFKQVENRIPLTGKMKKFVSEHFYFYGFIAQRLKAADPKVVAWLQKYHFLQRTIPETYVNFYRKPIPPEWQKRWQISLDLILEMQRVCQQANIPLIVWMFPLKEQVYARDREIFVRSYGLDIKNYDFDLPERQLEAFCAQNHITFVSPLARFRAEAKDGQRMHYLTDNHFNATGHKLMAEILLNEFQKWDLLHFKKEL